MPMSEELQRRLSRNEVLYRKVNEAIERGLWPGEERDLTRFRCECASMNCNATVEMTPGEYQAVRANPRRFLICEGHDLPGLDVVVERHPAYAVVEKSGAGGAEAEESDPRRD
ncbi:MAG TPA: hypothetical protein VG325_15320 [Solirubrobacteraceae bacterium]|jgi:hypothetical protein|nr:hypothetical protein [Solirubrobacteraceae bacterium]